MQTEGAPLLGAIWVQLEGLFGCCKALLYETAEEPVLLEVVLHGLRLRDQTQGDDGAVVRLCTVFRSRYDAFL